MNEASEVARLRARVAELERQLERAAAPDRPEPAADAGPGRSAWTVTVSALCLVLGCLLAPVSVASVWVNDTLGDTDAYVETVAPIAEEPAVQAALADTVTTTVVESLDLQGITTEALTTLSELEDMPPRVATALPALATPLTTGIESFARDQVERALASEQFAAIWAQVNRLAHEQVLQLLRGDQGGAVSAQGDTITLNLGPIVEQVTERMVAAGFTLAENVPAVDRQFTLVQSEAVTQAQSAYRFLDVLGTWLPFVSLALIAAGVLLARDRWRALVRGALGVTAAMVLLGAGLAVARTAYVGTTPLDVLTPEAAGEVFDTLVRFLRTTLRAVAVLGLVVAAAAFLSGHSPSAVRARSALERGIARVRSRGEEATGWDTGRVGGWLAAHRRGLRAAVVGLAALVLLTWSSPTAWVVLWTGLLAVVALGVLQLLASPQTAGAGTADPSPGSVTVLVGDPRVPADPGTVADGAASSAPQRTP